MGYPRNVYSYPRNEDSTVGEGLFLKMGLVVSSNIDFDDQLPGFRAPSLFIFAQQNSREKEEGQEVGTPNKLDSATL